jgi:hypothetical protein
MNNADVATLRRSLSTVTPQSPSHPFQSAGRAVSQSIDTELTDWLPVSVQPEQDVPMDNAPTKKKSSKGMHTGICYIHHRR